jgi:nucleotide-binding universal stress UspA family protein
MVEPLRRDLDRAVEASMDLFSRARVGTVAAIDPRRPSAVLLALDGTSQDSLGTAIARQLRERFDCRVSIVDARDKGPSVELAEQTAESLGGQAQPKTAGDSFEQILAAVEHSHCDLLITPCPYGRDLESVGPDSAGTVIDVLLARSPVPVLVVRQPYEPKGEMFRRVRMILTAENEIAPTAAAWGAGLIGRGGVFELILVLEREMYENFHSLIQSIAPEMEVSADSLSNALAQNYMRLHRGLQKTAAAAGFEYKLKLEVGGDASTSAAVNDGSRSLLVLALERSDPRSQGSVASRIRQSLNPVLVVSGPGGGPPPSATP